MTGTSADAAASVRPPPLWVLFSITSCAVMANTLLVPNIPDILEAFDLQDSAAGLLVAAGPAPGILLAPLVGLASDRHGRRAVLVPSLLLFGVAGLVAALAPAFGLLVLGRFVQGVGGAGLIGLVLATITDHWEGNDRTRIIGYNAAVLTTSIALLPTIGGFLGAAFGWRWAFAPYAVSLVAAALVSAALPAGRPAGQRPGLGEQLRAAGRVVRQPRLLAALALGFTLFFLIFGLFLTVFPLLLEERFGLGPAQIGLVTALSAASATVASLSLARLRGRLGARRLLWLGTATLTGAYLLVGLTPALGLILLAALAYGSAEGSTIPIIQDVVTSATPQEHRGAIATALVATFRAGQTVGPLAMGASLGALTTGGAFVVGAAVIGVVTLAQVVWAPRPPRRSAAAA